MGPWKPQFNTPTPLSPEGSGAKSTAPDLSGIRFSQNVEFQIRLDAMVALQRHNPTGEDWKGHPLPYDPPGHSYLRAKGQPIPPPPSEFRYVPLEPPPRASDAPSDFYVGWAVYTIAQAIHDEDLKTNWSSPFEENPYHPTVVSAAELEQVWSVSLTPRDVKEYQEVQYDWASIRITSPVYGPDNEAAQIIDELQRVLDVLNDDFITFPHSEQRLGTLVRPAGSSWQLDQLKGLASLLWVMSPLLDKMHPVHCGPGSHPSLGLQFTRLAMDHNVPEPLGKYVLPQQIPDPWDNRLVSPRCPLQLLKHPGELSCAKYAHKVSAILGAQDIEELCQLLGTVEPATTIFAARTLGPAYGFHNIAAGSETAMVEFNQHCATLDLEAVVRWTAVCARVVAGCCVDDLPPDYLAMMSLKQRDIDEGKVTRFDVISELSSAEMATYYEERGHEVQIPDLKDWPILKYAIADNDFQPSVSQALAQLHRRGFMTAETQTDEFAKEKENLLDSLAESAQAAHRKTAAQSFDSQYTMGIEIEMLLPTQKTLPSDDTYTSAENRETSRDPDSSDDRRYAWGTFDKHGPQLVAVLEELGGPARLDDYSYHDTRTREDHDGERRRYLGSRNLRPCSWAPLDYQMWWVMQDCSLTHVQGWRNYWRLGGIELASPIYRDKPECWESMLNTVSGLRQKMRLVVDDSCGFHVSVGKGEALMSFAFVKKLVCASFLADRVIFSLCHPARSVVSTYCNSLRDESNLAKHKNVKDWKHIPVPPDFAALFSIDELSEDECAMLKKVWTIGRWETLARLISSTTHGRSSVSINRLEPTIDERLEDEGTPLYFTGAVEFRYLEGTLDPELILRYSQLMVALYKFADNAEPEAWQAYASNLLDCGQTWSYDITILRNFLEHLGMSDDYEYWEGRVHTNLAILPSIMADRQWCREHPEERSPQQNRIQDLEILPKVPEDLVGVLRETVCQRQPPSRRVSHSEEPVRTLPTLRPVDTKEDLRNRVETMLQRLGRLNLQTKAFVQSILDEDQWANDVTEADLRRRCSRLRSPLQEPKSPRTVLTGDILMRACARAYRVRGLQGVFDTMTRHCKFDDDLADDIQVSRRDLNTFLGLDDSVDITDAFVFDGTTQVEGAIVEVDVSEEDVRRFLS